MDVSWRELGGVVAYLALFACRKPAGLELFCCLNDGPLLGAPYGLAGRF